MLIQEEGEPWLCSVIMKYFAWIFCSLYAYQKILQISDTSSYYRIGTAFSVLLALGVSCIRVLSAPFSILLMVGSFTMFVCTFTKAEIKRSITSSVIAFSVSYACYVFSSVLVLPVGYLLFHTQNDRSRLDLVFLVCIVILQLLFVTLLFQRKRLKHGMPFLKESGGGDIGVFISVSLLLLASLFGAERQRDLFFLIPIFILYLFGFGLFFWWKNSITKNYVSRARARELKAMAALVEEKDAEIAWLKSQNEELSRITHKDNKLVPAMLYAVQTQFAALKEEQVSSGCLTGTERLLEQLEVMAKDRSGILSQYELSNKKLPSTNVLSIDALLAYFLKKASQFKANLDLTLTGSVTFLIQQIVSEKDLNTLLADLIENAIIATKACQTKSILVHIGLQDDHYVVEVFDSAPPFPSEVVLQMGTKRITTHASDGGSGIGFMTTFSILKKYHASLIIDEMLVHQSFTKQVSIHFDRQGNFNIKTNRDDLCDQDSGIPAHTLTS